MGMNIRDGRDLQFPLNGGQQTIRRKWDCIRGGKLVLCNKNAHKQSFILQPPDDASGMIDNALAIRLVGIN